MSLERIFPVPRANENDVEHRRLLADALNEIARRLYAEAATDGPLLLAGRPGGQVAHGGTATGEDLELHSNTAEDGDINLGDTLYVDEANTRVGAGTASPAELVHALSSGNTRVRVQSSGTGQAGVELRNTAGTWRTQIVAGGYQLFDAVNFLAPLFAGAGAPNNTLVLGPAGVAMNGSGSFGGGVGVVFLANRTTAPASNPTGGGILYCEAGALKYRGSSGSVSTLALA